MKLNSFKTTKKRREFLEQTLKSDFNDIGKVLIDDESAVHCENLIGAVSIPLGVAGPVKINGDHSREEFYVPLATTEGALVASVSRGCKAISLGGGARVKVEEVGATRGPVFQTAGIEEGSRFKIWLDKNFSLLQDEAEKTSKHIELKKLETSIVGDLFFVRFYFDTDDAMGMNMATFATEKIVRLIEEKLKIKCISLAGNFDVDKKPAWLNFISGRGKRIWAESILSQEIVANVLKTTPQKIFDVWVNKCLIGSALSGSLGFNSHFANIIAAFFLATGQDPAHVVEGSLGITTTKILQNGALYLSVYLPAIMIGTIGGGTRLKTQTQARKITKVKNSKELAKILAAAVLAGEISLLSSLAEGSLSEVHKKLGR